MNTNKSHVIIQLCFVIFLNCFAVPLGAQTSINTQVINLVTPKADPYSYTYSDGLPVTFAQKKITSRYTSIKNTQNNTRFNRPQPGDIISDTGSVYVYRSMDKVQITRNDITPSGYKLIHPTIEAENITPNLDTLIELAANGSRHNPVWVQFESTVDSYYKGKIYLADITSFSAVEIDTESYRNQAIQYWYSMQPGIKSLLENQPELREVFLLNGQIDATFFMQQINKQFDNIVNRPNLFDAHYDSKRNLLELEGTFGFRFTSNSENERLRYPIKVCFLYDLLSQELLEVSLEQSYNPVEDEIRVIKREIRIDYK
jgi:hypothetical protein